MLSLLPATSLKCLLNCTCPADAQREQLTALLDDIYEDFVTCVARSRGKTREEVGRRWGLLCGAAGRGAVGAAVVGSAAGEGRLTAQGCARVIWIHPFI